MADDEMDVEMESFIAGDKVEADGTGEGSPADTPVVQTSKEERAHLYDGQDKLLGSLKFLVRCMVCLAIVFLIGIAAYGYIAIRKHMDEVKTPKPVGAPTEKPVEFHTEKPVEFHTEKPVESHQSQGTEEPVDSREPSPGVDSKPTIHELGLDKSKYTKIDHVVIGMDHLASVLHVRFTVEQSRHDKEGGNCSELEDDFFASYEDISGRGGVRQVVGDFDGCIVSDKVIWSFYTASLTELGANTKFKYELGQSASTVSKNSGETFKSTVKSLPYDYSKPGDLKAYVIGDTGPNFRQYVAAGMNKHFADVQHDISVLLHVGDQSYATNVGTCYSANILPKCEYSCSRDMECDGRDRSKLHYLKAWNSYFSTMGSLLSSIPLISTMGNHDNDLVYFFKFRPPREDSMPGVTNSDIPASIHDRVSLFRNELKGAETPKQHGVLNELLMEPFFRSVNVGSLHIISLQTEDNAINAYERAMEPGGLSREEQARFDKHFGVESSQFKWLQKDLESVDRTKTPWILVFKHRPGFSSSGHHPVCKRGGDWFKCAFRDLYTPVFEKYGVNVVFNGHSHHYSRSKPLIYNNKTRAITPTANITKKRDDPVYFVIGTAGMKLDGRFGRFPDWIAKRSTIDYGFGLLETSNNTMMTFNYYGVPTASSAKNLYTMVDNTTIRQDTV
mmetsp:Transcript_16988/g.27498  ORF Transcript_16988/g.27498 Transcript_16988/m.27498 type:complete len:673 (-) Transcript_16988:128-2146(-)